MKLSIIMPVYNLEKYISYMLTSLCALHLPYKYEILIINDGSKDNTISIIEKYQILNHRIKLITIENGGVSNARNIGIMNAQGKYITFVDGDDYVDPFFFNLAVNEMDIGGYDFVQVNYRVISDKGNSDKLFVNKDMVISNRIDMVHALLGKKNQVYNAVWGKVFRSDTIKDLRFDTELRIAEDRKFVFDVIKSAKEIKLLKHLGYNYIKRSNSAMHGENRVKYGDNLKVLEYIKNYTDNDVILTDIERRELLLLIGLYHLNLYENKDNREYYCMIRELNTSNFWLDLDWKMKTRVLLIEKAPWIYNSTFCLIKRRKKRRE